MDLRTILIVSVLVVVLTLHQVCARPSVSDSWNHSSHNTLDDLNRHPINECEDSYQSLRSNEVRELCQRCAKVTKSKRAYPSCCEKGNDARVWCVKFLNFGLSSYN